MLCKPAFYVAAGKRTIRFPATAAATAREQDGLPLRGSQSASRAGTFRRRRCLALLAEEVSRAAPIPGRCRWQPPGISAMSHCVLGILCGLPKKAPARTAGARGPERWPVWRRIYSFTISMAFAWVLPVALRGMATCSTPFLQRAVMASTSASSGRANTRWKEPYVRSSTCWLF